MPAASVAVSLKGKLIYQRAFGYRDLERKTNLQPNQPFRAASLSRILTVVAALQLVDRGKLKLNQSVYQMLDVKPWKEDSVDERSRDITVLNLLQETAGHDQRATFDPGLIPTRIARRMGLNKGTLAPDELMQYMLSQSLTYTPGSKSKTSSYGYFLLGRVIEKASGQPYEKYVMENIAEPIGLSSLTMSRTDPAQRSKQEVKNVQRAGAYYPKIAGDDAGQWVLFNEGGINFDLLDASHGWMISPSDMLNLMTAIQASPSSLLSDDAKVLLIAKPDYFLARKDPGRVWKACSLFCRKTNNGITFWRHTQDLNCCAGLVCFSTSGLSYCFMFNTQNTAAGENPKDFFDGLLNRESNRVRRSIE